MSANGQKASKNDKSRYFGKDLHQVVFCAQKKRKERKEEKLSF